MYLDDPCHYISRGLRDMDSTNKEHELRLLRTHVEAITWTLLARELEAWTVLRGHTRYPSVRLSFPFGWIAIRMPVQTSYLREILHLQSLAYVATA